MILSPLTRLITYQTEGCPYPAFSDIIIVTTQPLHDKLCSIGVIPHYPTRPKHERLREQLDPHPLIVLFYFKRSLRISFSTSVLVYTSIIMAVNKTKTMNECLVSRLSCIHHTINTTYCSFGWGGSVGECLPWHPRAGGRRSPNRKSTSYSGCKT